jgi:hypothetical protein
MIGWKDRRHGRYPPAANMNSCEKTMMECFLGGIKIRAHGRYRDFIKCGLQERQVPNEFAVEDRWLKQFEMEM